MLLKVKQISTSTFLPGPVIWAVIWAPSLLSHPPAVVPALNQAVFTQELLRDHVKPLRYDGWLIIGYLLGEEGIPVQVDPHQLVQPRETAGDAGESVVGEADLAELLQRTDGGGKRFQLVEAQVECVELLQQAELAGEAHQTVVTQVQNPQVLEMADADRELLQLQQKHSL